jgi:hypothetical protein
VTAGRVRFRSGANFRLSEVDADIDYEAVGLVADDGGASRGLLYRRRGTRPTVGVHLLHPRTDQSQNYNILPLVRAGCLVLGRAGRWVNNDVATEHERLVLDLAAGVRLLRERGCEQVVLLGNSGGGALAAFYQWQARTPPPDRLSQTVAGDRIDLEGADLPAADGIVLIGAHCGQGASLLKWIDPSVVDENDPYLIDPGLDLYNPVNGFRLPPESSAYDTAFVQRFRAAQRERVARLDGLARARIARRRAAGAAGAAAAEAAAAGAAGAAAAAGAGCAERLRLEREGVISHPMVIYRTMADPAFVDLSIEPDDRVISAYNNHPRPDLVNYGTGVATMVTPEAWLSTWSGLSSLARTADCLRRVPDPLLVVHYMGDVITRVSEAEEFVAASPADDKQMAKVRHADHYGFALGPDGTRGARTTAGTDIVTAWMRDRFPLR